MLKIRYTFWNVELVFRVIGYDVTVWNSYQKAHTVNKTKEYISDNGKHTLTKLCIFYLFRIFLFLCTYADSSKVHSCSCFLLFPSVLGTLHRDKKKKFINS